MPRMLRRLFLSVTVLVSLLAAVPVFAHTLPVGGSRWSFGKNSIVANLDLNSSLLSEIKGIKEGHYNLDSSSDEQLQQIARDILQPYISKKLSLTVDNKTYPLKLNRMVRNGDNLYTIWLSADNVRFKDTSSPVRIHYTLLFEETNNAHVNLAYGYLSDATGDALQSVFDSSPPAFQTTFDSKAPEWELSITGTKSSPNMQGPERKAETPVVSGSTDGIKGPAAQKSTARNPKVPSPMPKSVQATSTPDKASAAVSLLSSPGVSTSVGKGETSGPRGLSRKSLWASIGEFLKLGIEHILTGYDHIAFLMALIVIGLSLREVLKIITAFTVAHSITLLLAALEIVRLNSRFVESVIAFSICYVALENLFRKKVNYRWLITFGFGLIHGFGFASALQELIVGKSNLLLSVLSFNMGVEIGQLMIVFAVLPVLYLLKKKVDFRIVTAGTSAAIFFLGFTWLIERLLDLRILGF